MKFYYLIPLFFSTLCYSQEPKKAVEHKQLQDSVIFLQDVSVQGKKQLIKRKADRLEFNVNNTSLQNLNAWDILKNTPNVLVRNDALMVRGSAQILVTLNDKKILMTQDELKQYLENLDGKNVTAIEVITNPPAKYDAQGAAVINIKTIQTELLGYKGRVGLRYHQSIYAKNQINIMNSFNSNKWQFTANYAFVDGVYVRYNKDVIIYDSNNTRWESDIVRKSEARNQHRYEFSAQYKIDSLEQITFSLDGSINPKSAGNYKVPTLIYNTMSNAIESSYITNNARLQKYDVFNANLNYDKKFGAHQINWSNYFSEKGNTENQDIFTELNFINQPQTFNRFASSSQQNIKLFATQFDYQYTKNLFKLEAGTKYSAVENTNNLSFYDSDLQNLLLNPLKSNNFKYRENIFAGYISANYKLGKWDLKAGLRSETININTVSNNPIVQNEKLTTKIFPTLYLLYNIKDDEQLGFSYGKRIDRPNYDFLNPSKSYYNLYSYFQGDANLKSSLIDNLSLTYSVKDWNFEAYYSFNKFPSMEISTQDSETFQTVYNFTNIEKRQNWGANVSKNWSLTNMWQLNAFAMAEYDENYYQGRDGLLHRNKVLFYNANLSTQLTLDQKKTWDLSIGYYYNSKSIQGSFNISSSQNLSMTLNKKIFNKRLDLGLILNDFFKTDKNTISTKYADQNQYFTDYRDTQYFILNLKYNFGNQKLKDTKAIIKTDEQNRF